MSQALCKLLQTTNFSTLFFGSPFKRNVRKVEFARADALKNEP